MSQGMPDSCPDCQGTLQVIRLGNSVGKDTSIDGMELRYVTARFDMYGTVNAVRCDRCTRIFLYGKAAQTR